MIIVKVKVIDNIESVQSLKKKVAAVVQYTCVLAQFSSDYYWNPHCEDGGFDIVGAVIAVFKTNHHSREKNNFIQGWPDYFGCPNVAKHTLTFIIILFSL